MCFSRRSRLPFGRPQTYKPVKPLHRRTCVSQAPAMCFLRRSRLPFGRPQTHQTPQTLPQAYMPQLGPCVFYGVRDCRLAARKPIKTLKPVKPLKPLHRPTCLSQAPATCFLRRSRLPFGRLQTHQTPQTPQTPPQAYMPQPGPSHVFFTAFETAVWPPANPSNPSNPSTGLHASARPQPYVSYGVRDCRLAARKPIKPLKPVKPLKPFHRPTCLSQAPAMCFFWSPANPSNPCNPPSRRLAPLGSQSPRPSVFKGIQGCRLPALQPGTTAICF